MTAIGQSVGNTTYPLRRLKLCSNQAPGVAPDWKHSQEEDRLIAVGRTDSGRAVFVGFTLRTKSGRRFIRPVTARYMHAKEVAAYEEAWKTKVPNLKSDSATETFLAQDLSGLDFSQFRPTRFEFEKKTDQIDMRVSRSLLAAVKARAKERGIPYTRLIRETLQRAMSTSK